MTRIGVFAYGSLVNAASFEQTLGRVPPAPSPARLCGWRRRWSVVRDNLATEKTFAAPGGELPRWVLGLNVETAASKDGSLAPNGALFEVSAAELERLDLREMRYARIEVTGAVAEQGFDRVFAYTARSEHYSADPPPGAIAMAPYLRTIEAAFRSLGEGEWELFLQTTGLPPVEAIEPTLIRDQIPPGNPREW